MFGAQSAITLVESSIDDRRAQRTAQYRDGDVLSGFSTTSALAQADSVKKCPQRHGDGKTDHRAKERNGCGFHDATYMLGL